MAGEKEYGVAIIGAGHAGAQAAIALRKEGFAGTVALIGDEPDPPYERPPLSKDYLKDEKTFERMLIRRPDFWADKEIALLPATRIEAVDAATRRLRAAEGPAIQYGKLIWAAGGRPRPLPCGSDVGLRGVHAVRTRTDVDRLKAELPAARRAVIIGGGYIGLEAAAAMAGRGLDITVIEAEDRLLARVAGAHISAFYRRRHEAAGVRFLLATRTSCLRAEDGAVAGVELELGETLPADIVIVGIGILPNVEPLLAAGAEGDNGVMVDASCRTSLPDIWAIGDCARHRNPYAGGAAVRLESVQNANDQANVAAADICGRPAKYEALPWFWSNQYEVRLQTAGLSAGHDEAVLRGDPETGRFSVCYLKAGQLIAADCIGRPADFVQAQKLIAAGVHPQRAALEDPETPLKSLLPV